MTATTQYHPPDSVTVSDTAGDVEGLKAAESVGVNTAISWCDPAANVDVVTDAAPLVTVSGVPRLVVPSLNCTVPAAFAGVIAAVSVTGVP